MATAELQRTVAVLRAAGWAAHDLQAVQVERTRSSHALLRVRGGTRSAVIKQASAEALGQQRHLGHELFMYRLARSRPALAALLPRALWLDEARQLVVVEDLSRGVEWPTAPATLTGHPGLALRVARQLACLHRHTEGLSLPPTPALGLLGLEHGLAEACRDRSAHCVALLRHIAADARWCATFARAARELDASCIVHGDLRCENWLIDPRGRLRLIDWELSGSGDAAWDVGSLLAQQALESSGEPAMAPPEALAPLLLAYRRAGGRALAPAKVLRLGAVRLLHRATESAEYGVALDAWPVVELLARAHAWVDAAERFEAQPAARKRVGTTVEAAVATGGDPRLRLTLTRLPSPRRARQADLTRLLPVLRAGAHLDAQALADHLYAQWYARVDVGDGRDAHAEAADAATEPAPLAGRLRAALPRLWQSDWVCLHAPDAHTVVAGRAAQVRQAGPGDHVNLSRPGVPAVPGDTLALLATPAWVDDQTGWFVVHAAAGEPRGELLRSYWSVGAPALPEVLRSMLAVLAPTRLRWSLKCPTQAAACARADTLVVYVEHADAAALLPLQCKLARRVRAQLRAQRPALTRPLAHGVGIACDPGNGRSFGQHLCQRLAAVVVAERPRPLPAGAAAFERLCAERGLALDDFWEQP